MFRREILTRPVADESSIGNPGNGMRFKLRYFKRGADPPKNESGMAGAVSSFE